MTELDRELKKTRRRIITANIIFGLLILPWPFFALVAAMMADAPGAGANFITQQLILSVWTYPVVVFISIVAAWLFYKRNNHTYARRAAILPLANFAYFFVMMILLSAVCGGQFACK